MDSAIVHHPIDEAIAALQSSGFDDEAIARLIIVRRHCYEGRFTELTREARYLQFVKWLYRQGRIGG